MKQYCFIINKNLSYTALYFCSGSLLIMIMSLFSVMQDWKAAHRCRFYTSPSTGSRLYKQDSSGACDS